MTTKTPMSRVIAFYENDPDPLGVTIFPNDMPKEPFTNRMLYYRRKCKKSDNKKSDKENSND
jgi:hypothetical protein